MSSPLYCETHAVAAPSPGCARCREDAALERAEWAEGNVAILVNVVHRFLSVTAETSRFRMYGIDTSEMTLANIHAYAGLAAVGIDPNEDPAALAAGGEEGKRG